MLLSILLVIFGVVALTKNELTIIGQRKIMGTHAKIIGILMLIGAIANLVIPVAGGITFVGVLIVGLSLAKKPESKSE